MAIKDANNLAAYILHKRRTENKAITHLELQKLLYFCQAWYLVFRNEPLFPDPIEAWEHGPVVESVYQNYKGYKADPIIETLSDATILEDEDIPQIDAILNHYDGFTAWELRDITHKENPWKEYYVEEQNNIIPTDYIKGYYREHYYAGKHLVFDQIQFENTVLHLKETLVVKIKYDEETKMLYAVDGIYGLEAYGFFDEDLKAEINEQIYANWIEIASEEDAMLTPQARMLKHTLLASIM